VLKVPLLQSTNVQATSLLWYQLN